MTSLDTTGIVGGCKAHLANCIGAMWASLAMLDARAPHVQEGKDALAKGDSLLAAMERSASEGATVRALLAWLDAAVRLDESALRLSLAMPGLPWVPVAQAAHRVGSAISTELQRYAGEREAVPSAGADYVRELQAALEKTARELRLAQDRALADAAEVKRLRRELEEQRAVADRLAAYHAEHREAVKFAFEAREWAFREVLKQRSLADFRCIEAAEQALEGG